MAKLRTVWLQVLLAVIIMVVLILGTLAVVYLPQYPQRQAASFRASEYMTNANLDAEERFALEKELLLYETDTKVKIWTAIVQAFGGAALLAGLFFTWSNLRATQVKLDIDREGQLTSRFTEATTQLGAQLSDGKPNIEVRLGAIYALARIARDSQTDYWPVMEILTAYVRHSAPWREPETQALSKSDNGTSHPKPRTDIQAILTVLGRSAPGMQKDRRLDQKLDLRGTDLRGAEFWDAQLERTDFWGAHLEEAQLWGACLDHAKLVNAHLQGANLKGAQFVEAELTGAFFDGAALQGADFRKAHGLSKEQILTALNSGAGALLPTDLLETG